MALIFDEQFEATGYDETSAGAGSNWTEQADGGGTINEDFAVSSVPGGDPGNWGSQCVQIVRGSSGSTGITNDLDSSYATLYFRADFVFDNISVVSSWGPECIWLKDSNWNPVLQVYVINESGSYSLGLVVAGTDPSDEYSIVESTKYRIDFYYAGATGDWEWKVNGVSQGTGSNGSAANIQRVALGAWRQAGTGLEVYIDNVQLATDGWVPEDSAGGSIPLLVTNSLGGNMLGGNCNLM